MHLCRTRREEAIRRVASVVVKLDAVTVMALPVVAPNEQYSLGKRPGT